MKNLINYYYNLILDEFRKIDDFYIFDVNKNKYIFMPFEGDVKNLYSIYSLIYSNRMYCHQIILNKDNSVVTFYENKPYVLLKKNTDIKSTITVDDLIKYDIPTYDKNSIDWKKLWQEKIDYYEYQINQLGFKYPIIRNSFSYYIGLSETAISLLNYINIKDVNLYVSHRRICFKETMDNFFNPLNIILDSRVRDLAEFFKINYINEAINIDEIIKYIDKLNFDYSESILFLSRVIYPSYYFDIYDKIIQEKIKEEKIEFYIKKNVYYETFLKQIYKYLKFKYQIPQIEYLEN